MYCLTAMLWWNNGWICKEVSNKSGRIYIKNCIGEEESFGFGGVDYPETTTLVEQFFPDCKWIRYTYDFGDDWRHKIIFEKMDKSYEERYASLLKVKGANFEEDIGDDWENDEDGEDCQTFDVQAIAESLRELVFTAK